MNSGFLLINKDKNISSSKIDYYLKKKFNLKKCGHLGTLDPLAEGLLIVGINDATKYFKYFEGENKAYILRIRLGATSSSLDYEKELTDFIDTNLVGKEKEIDMLLYSYKKKYNQYPPIYSAIKVNGNKLYEYAYKNIDVEIKAREVEIFDIKRISDLEYIDGSTYFDIYLHVSKGFYVRSFAKEIADFINTSGMADNIKRIKVGKFHINNAKSLDLINTDDLINPIDFLDFKKKSLDDVEYKKVLNGTRISFDSLESYLLLTYKNENIAIYKRNSNYYEMDLLIKK